MNNSAQLARALINTRALPAGIEPVRAQAQEARAYYRCSPYPLFWFRDWKTEDRGPLPVCLPIARRAISIGARWLFGVPPQVRCAGNDRLEALLRDTWRQNRLSSRLVAMARNGGIEGGIALKFAYDNTSARQVSIQALSIIDECRLFYNPHDCEELLLARVQYPYNDPGDGKTYWYREEWTAENLIRYAPVADEVMRGVATTADPDKYEGWQITAEEPNPFGLIPVVHVRNIETDDVYGAADFWEPIPPTPTGGLFRVLDRINLTFHLMDRSNQFDSNPSSIFIDADLDEQDINRPLQPGEPIKIDSVEGEHQAKVHQIESRGSLRPAMMEYAKELKRQFLAAVSSVDIDPAEVTNKGNMTTAVLKQLYAPLIEITGEKRKSYGDSGLVTLFEAIGRGLQHAGVDLGVTDDPDTYHIELDWPAYFDLTQDELAALTERTQEQVLSRFLTQDRAIERVARAEGITDVPALLEEIAKEPAPAAVAADAAQVAAAMNDPNIAAGAKDLSNMRRTGGKASL